MWMIFLSLGVVLGIVAEIQREILLLKTPVVWRFLHRRPPSMKKRQISEFEE